MGKAVIFKGNRVQTLKDQIQLRNGATVKSIAVDPTSVATDGEVGDLALSTSTGKGYVKTDSGVTVNWTDLTTGADPILEPDRNLFINGALDFWQRFPTGTTAANGDYTADRWFTVSGTSHSVDRITDVSLKKKYMRITNASNIYVELTQRIERANVAELAGKTLSIQLDAKKFTGTENLEVLIRAAYPTSSTEDDYSSGVTNFYAGAAITSNLGSTFETLQDSFTLDNLAAERGLEVTIRVNPVALDLFQVDLSDLMLCVCSQANLPEFRRAGRTIGEELALCQRFYEKSTAQNVAEDGGTTNGLGIYRCSGSFSNAEVVTERFSTTKRISPTVNIYSIVGGSGPGRLRNTTQVLDKSAEATVISESGFNVRHTNTLGPSSDLDFLKWQWTADAEL